MADRLLGLVAEFPDKIVVFTQFLATQEMLRRRLADAGHDVAVFHGGKKESRAAVPATAILHLHDREWVDIPLGTAGHEKQFRRVEVSGGDMLPGNLQEVSGIQPGQRVVGNALEFQNTVERQ